MTVTGSGEGRLAKWQEAQIMCVLVRKDNELFASNDQQREYLPSCHPSLPPPILSKHATNNTQ